MKKLVFLCAFLSASILFGSRAEACTGMKLVAKDGSLVHGRTLEFGIPVEISIAVVPRGYTFMGATPKGPGLSYTSKYAAVGASAFSDPALMDGLNEKGLAVGTFYFPGFADYTAVTAQNQSRGLSPVDFSNWILTQFATVEEVKAGIRSVVITPTVTRSWGAQPAPFHYIVYDKTGDCVVIEPVGGKLLLHDNKLGVLTNSPTFDWHMTNLRNYIHLSPWDDKSAALNGIALEAFGWGSGMVGLPGDFTPPSRFVRAALFSANALPSANASEAAFQLFHLLNQFDIPVGISRVKKGEMTYTDETQITCVRDPQALKYYFRSYEDQSIKLVELTQFDLNAPKIKSVRLTGISKAQDLSSQLR